MGLRYPPYATGVWHTKKLLAYRKFLSEMLQMAHRLGIPTKEAIKIIPRIWTLYQTGKIRAFQTLINKAVEKYGYEI